MASNVRIADYFYIEVPERVGEGARALSQLRDAGVNLLALSGFPAGRRAQIDFVPEDPGALRAAAKKAGWKLTGPKKIFLIEGEDRVGVMADAMERLGAAKISVIASQAICAGAGRFGAILWVAPRDVKRAAKALGAS
jgi:hypothetical protein